MTRLADILHQAVWGSVRRVLEVGCGADPAPLAGKIALGLDIDGAALRAARRADPARRLVQADARTLPGLLHTHFDLVLVRHPDVQRSRAAWTAILPALSGCLVPGGVLLITLYALDEVELVDALPMPPRWPLDDAALAPPDLAGRDRFVRAYRR